MVDREYYDIVMEMIQALDPAAMAAGLNSGAFLFFVGECQKYERLKFEDLTLKEIRQALEKSVEDYNLIYGDC